MAISRRAAAIIALVVLSSACAGAKSTSTGTAGIRVGRGGAAALISLRWPRVVRAGSDAVLVRVTHQSTGSSPISYRWAEVLERTPATCPLGIPILSRRAFVDSTRIKQWPGEQINLRPGESETETLHETLSANCHGTFVLSLLAVPLNAAATAQRRQVSVTVDAV